MGEIIKKLREHESLTKSEWRTKAQFRKENKSWLRYSQMIALLMHDKMEDLNMTQKMLAELMGVSQQYISKILKGHENLSLETLSKIETALNLKIISTSVAV